MQKTLFSRDNYQHQQNLRLVKLSGNSGKRENLDRIAHNYVAMV